MEAVKQGRVTQNLSLQPSDHAALVSLAEQYDGGNKSRTIQRLIRLAWEQIRSGTDLGPAMPAPITEEAA